MIEVFEEEEIKLDIAQHVYELRDSTGQTQEEFGELVGVDPIIIDDLGESDYEGDSLAGMTEWCHLDGRLRGNFSGNPNEYIHASTGHNQLIEALIHYIQTGERTAFKQWQQNMGGQEEARYINELEAALQQNIFEEFPDTEWLVQTLLGFLKIHVKEESSSVIL